jgi:hypothetical protein
MCFKGYHELKEGGYEKAGSRIKLVDPTNTKLTNASVIKELSVLAPKKKLAIGKQEDGFQWGL